MKKLVLVLTVITLFGLVAGLALTQDNGGEISPVLEITGANASKLPTVTVTSNVYDTVGQPFRELTTDDFTVSGELADFTTIVDVQNITDDDLSFAIVLVIDTSTSMAGPPILAAQRAARQFVNALGPNDPVAIITFDTTVRLVQEFTTDRALLLNTIDTLAYGGQTALYDAGVTAVRVASESPLPRRAVVLLSDGAEYGRRSSNPRAGAVTEALVRGVPVYTIGLGYGADRTYLEELSAGTNARFYESPTAEELSAIYDELAALFRSQYVVTLEVDVPPDGTVYTLEMQVETKEGPTNTATASLRAPILRPIVSLPADLFAAPIAAVTDIEISIAADDSITAVDALVNGESVSVTTVSEGSYTITIDPLDYAPGSYSFSFSATDADGDTGSAEASFEIAALAPELTLEWDPGSAPISEPQTLTAAIGGQTAGTSVTYSIDGGAGTEVTEAPYSFSFDPFELAPGEHSLSVTALNAGGQTTTFEQSFSAAAIPPRVSFSGLESGFTLETPLEVSVDAAGQTAIAAISASVGGVEVFSSTDEASASFSLDPAALPPGPAALTLTVTDAAGTQAVETVDFVVAALAPELAVEGLETGSVVSDNVTVSATAGGQTPITALTYSVDGGPEVDFTAEGSFTLDVEELGSGTYTLAVTAANAGGVSTTAEIDFEVLLPPPPTDTPTPVPPTSTPTPVPPTATATEAPEEPTATATEEPTEAPEEPTEIAVVATEVPEEETPEPTEAVEEPTEIAVVATDVPDEEETPEPTEAVEEPTEAPEEPTEAVEEPTAEPTLTPVAITEVEPEDTTAAETDIAPILLVIGVGLLLLLLFFFLSRRGQQN